MKLTRSLKLIYQLMAMIGLFTFITSCSPSLTPFTQELYDHSSLSESDLKKVQFYVSRDVVLFREFRQGESRITNGKIKLKNGKQIEEVVIKSGTPGALLFIPKANRFAISFESGEDSPFLMFGPNPKMDNRYALLAKEWKKYEGKVHYAGKIYRVESDAAFASLLVDIDRLGETQVRRKIAEGRQVK